MGLCFTKDIVAAKVGVRQKRLSMSMDPDDVPPPDRDQMLCASPAHACAVVTEPGVEYDVPKTNQDAFYIDEEHGIFAVMDGHGRNGHLCSAFCVDHMRVAFQKLWQDKGGHSASTVCDTLVAVDDQLKKQAGIDCRFSGTTVTCCAVLPHCVISAWLGDSRAIMGRWKGTTISLVELSKDHKPDNPLERKRILKAGGRIRQIVDEDGNKAGGLRVFVPSQEVPGVNFSRSLGDNVIHAFGVSSDVDCIVTPRSPEDRFVIVGSDGIFEFLKNEEVLGIVARSRTVQEAADQLVSTAKARWLKAEMSADDITVAVIKLG